MPAIRAARRRTPPTEAGLLPLGWSPSSVCPMLALNHQEQTVSARGNFLFQHFQRFFLFFSLFFLCVCVCVWISTTEYPCPENILIPTISSFRSNMDYSGKKFVLPLWMCCHLSARLPPPSQVLLLECQSLQLLFAPEGESTKVDQSNSKASNLLPKHQWWTIDHWTSSVTQWLTLRPRNLLFLTPFR